MKYREKEQAIALRKLGLSLDAIAKQLAVSKASVSVWVRDVVLSSEQLKQINDNFQGRESVEKRRVARIANEHNKRQGLIQKAEDEISSVNLEELKLIGCALYFAEGGKTVRGMVRLANSNPQMIKIMMRFFREVCMVQESKFRGHIHTHSVAQVRKAEAYWSEITGIPVKQFFKTYCVPPKSSSQNKRNLQFGTFDIYVCDTKLFLKIQGWTQKICKILLD
jgi:predicted transcriptional regulator